MRPSAPVHPPVQQQPGLVRSTASALGIDPHGCLAFLDSLSDVDLHSVMLLRHGRIAMAGWWHPYAPDRVHLLYSLSKSVCSTAAGFAVAEGLLGLDDRVLDHLGELSDVCHPDLRDLRIRHVLSMSSGHADDVLLHPDVRARLDRGDIDLAGELLSAAPAARPGTLFAYNQPATFTAAAVVQRVTGQSLTAYLGPRLFAPLGIEPGHWEADRRGRQLGFTGFHLTTEAIAAFGQFVLQRGRWNDRQLIPSAWFDEATAPQISTTGADEIDWAQGYGFQFWMARHGFRGDGAYGQFCVLLPEQDVVLVTTAATEQMQRVLDAAWTHLLPAMSADGRPIPAGPAERQLTDRMSDLALDHPRLAPIVQDRALQTDSAVDWISATHVLVDRLRLTIDRHPHEVPARADRWTTGAWPDGRPVSTIAGEVEGRFWASIVLLDTPHRLLLVENADGRVGLDWHTPPLRNLDPGEVSW